MDDQWVTSSFCADSACVEVQFQRSTRCGSATCVEVGYHDGGDGGTVYVRDGKDRGGLVLAFPPAVWAAFLDGVTAGEFDG